MNSTDAAKLAHLAAEVHAARATLNLGQNEFARRCGVDPSVLSKLIRGKVLAEPSEKRIRAFLRRVPKLVARERKAS